MNTNLRTGLVFLVVPFFLISCYKDVYYPVDQNSEYAYLAFNETQLGIDTVNHLLLCPVSAGDLEEWEVEIYAEPLKILKIEGRSPEKDVYRFGNIDLTRTYSVLLQFPEQPEEEYLLQFSSLPVFQIYSRTAILNELKVDSWISISMVQGDEPAHYGHIGIEYRGASGIWRPKKSFGIEFQEDVYDSDEQDVGFFNLLEDDDWILDAMYIDQARMRKALSLDLWNDMQADRLPEQDFLSTSSRGGYVEVFLNMQYAGLYYLHERIDQKRLGLVPTGESLEGVLYKSEDRQASTQYLGLAELQPGVFWGGWELKYPEDQGIEAWYPLYDYLSFVIGSSDKDFVEGIFEWVDKKSLVDYFLFMNIINAMDNQDKNIFLARFDRNSRFFFIPWDLDASWGRTFRAEVVEDHILQRNKLYERLFELDPEQFKTSLHSRWNDLKKTVFNPDSVQSRISVYHNSLVSSGALIRDNNAWPDASVTIDQEVRFMQDWYISRYEYLDACLDSLYLSGKK
ncbi:MAG: CotH kinase family protein [Bacteroidales bacterium]|nr:CotH kinase family protein [Bacteroidales bacterium]